MTDVRVMVTNRLTGNHKMNRCVN